MYTKLILLVTLMGAVTSQPIQRKIMDSLMNGPIKELFKAYHLIYQKEYDINTPEGIIRYKIFKSNLAFIKEENSKQSDYKLGINHFADMTKEEIAKTFPLHQQSVEKNTEELERLSIPFLGKQGYNYTPGAVTVDWTSKMYPTMRDKKNCGSCYAHASLAALEGNFFIKTGISKMFSVQQILDCDISNLQCQGGYRLIPYCIYKTSE